MEKASHKLNKNKKIGLGKKEKKTTQPPIVIRVAGEEIHRIAKNLKAPFGEQKLPQTTNDDETICLCDSALKAAWFFLG